MLTKYKIVPFCPYYFVHTILSNAILSVYHFAHTILSVPFCPLPFCPVSPVVELSRRMRYPGVKCSFPNIQPFAFVSFTPGQLTHGLLTPGQLNPKQLTSGQLPPELGQYLLRAQPICNTQTRNMLYMFDNIVIDLHTSKLREKIYEKDNFKATQRVYYNLQTSKPREENSVTKYM